MRSSRSSGPSGCGKSTLLSLICGLDAPDAGTVDAPAAALMPQRDALLPWLSALDNAALALRVAGDVESAGRARPPTPGSSASAWTASSRRGRPRSPAACASASRSCARCSPGAPLLCLDEPFDALDALTRAQAQTWLGGGARTRVPRTVVLVTHDVEEAVLLADRIVLMSPRPGKVVAELEVDLPRPRARTDLAVVELRERALAALGVTS